jgi:hypothetical protein
MKVCMKGIMMNIIQSFKDFKSKGLLLAALMSVTAVGSSAALTGVVRAQSGTTTLTPAQQQHLQTIITKGDQEITRRLATLNTLTGKINAATRLTASDKSTLSGEVAATVSGLTTLKTTLDAETTLSAAHTDVQSIYSEYRVYALVAPKVSLIKVADDEQIVEGKLTTLSQKLQARITTEQQASKDVTALQADLSDMTSKTTAAQSISSSIESKVITLQPTDYNSDHALLSGDRDQLKTAHTDNQAAYADAKTIVAALKTMK